MKGNVKFYNSEKGFGFLKVQGSKDMFFHKSALLRGETLKDGDSVEFETEETERGQAAITVRKI